MTVKDDLIINDEHIRPGQQAVIRLNIGRLPSSTRIFIYLHVYRGDEPGPVMLVMGGLHGDEINGVEIVKRAIRDGMFNNIKAGAVIAIPILNIYGFLNFSREVPDGKDVNRSFPGSMRGSLASRVAKTFSKKVLPHVDFGLDYHTGGGPRYNYPQIRYTKNDKGAEEIARMFAAPFVMEKGVIRGSLRKHAKENNVPIAVYEGGEALRFDGHSIEIGLQGMRRVMEGKGMIEGKSPVFHDTISFKRTTWIRAADSGLFVWFKSSGKKVVKGEPLGEVSDPFGNRRYIVRAKSEGYIIGHNNAPVIHQGDALFHIGIE
ncbi:MAG: succinylglutamate desuccinylase/aspartoacylase family protein [Saprospiraceae bacterium]|nr:succinylglutamate desuccinylase/aspartoacylase family protein [Saprospiraceae bacterium]